MKKLRKAYATPITKRYRALLYAGGGCLILRPPPQPARAPSDGPLRSFHDNRVNRTVSAELRRQFCHLTEISMRNTAPQGDGKRSDTGGEFDVRRMFSLNPPRSAGLRAAQAPFGAAPAGHGCTEANSPPVSLGLTPCRLSQAPLQPVQRGLPASSAQRIRFLSYIFSLRRRLSSHFKPSPDKRLTS